METHGSSYQFAGFTLDLAKGCLFNGVQEIKLRPKVYEALKYLVEHPGRLISKQELMQAVWPDSFVTDDSLVQCALKLAARSTTAISSYSKLCLAAGTCFPPKSLNSPRPQTLSPQPSFTT